MSKLVKIIKFRVSLNYKQIIFREKKILFNSQKIFNENEKMI